MMLLGFPVLSPVIRLVCSYWLVIFKEMRFLFFAVVILESFLNSAVVLGLSMGMLNPNNKTLFLGFDFSCTKAVAANKTMAIHCCFLYV